MLGCLDVCTDMAVNLVHHDIKIEFICYIMNCILSANNCYDTVEPVLTLFMSVMTSDRYQYDIRLYRY